MDFRGTLGKFISVRVDIHGEIPPPMCGGGLLICGATCSFFQPLFVQVLAMLVHTSVQLSISIISGASDVQSEILALIAVLCSMLSQAGCADEVRLRCHTLRAAPANAGLGLAILIG